MLLYSRLENMPITHSAKKALRQNIKARTINAKKKRTLHDLIKEIRDLSKQGKKEEVAKLFPKLMQTADKMAKTRVIAKNKASRLKSEINRLVK